MLLAPSLHSPLLSLSDLLHHTKCETHARTLLDRTRAPRASQRCAQGRYRAQHMRALAPSLRALDIVLHRDDEENDALREGAPAEQAMRDCGGQR